MCFAAPSSAFPHPSIEALVLGLGLVTLLSDPWEAEFAPRLVTIGDAVRATWPMEVNHGGQRLIAESDVLEEVRRLAAETIGVKFEEVRPDSDLVRDLHMG